VTTAGAITAGKRAFMARPSPIPLLRDGLPERPEPGRGDPGRGGPSELRC